MTAPLWKLLRHSGDSEHYWRLIEQSHDEARLRQKLDEIREDMVDGGVRLTKETVEFEGWDRGGKRQSHHASSMTDIRNSRVKKPCAGCGETPMYGREKDKVCADCHRLIEEAKKARESASKQKGRFVQIPMHFPTYSARYQRSHYYESSDGVGNALGQVIRALATPSSAPRGDAVERLFEGNEGSYSYQGDVYEVGKDAVKAIRLLHERLEAAVEGALRAGYDEGQNFLMSLASGEISVKEFNESTIQNKDARKKRK